MSKVSVFSKAKLVLHPKDYELDTVLNAIKSGKWQDKITELRQLEGAAFQARKRLLPGFTVSGTFPPGAGSKQL